MEGIAVYGLSRGVYWCLFCVCYALIASLPYFLPGYEDQSHTFSPLRRRNMGVREELVDEVNCVWNTDLEGRTSALTRRLDYSGESSHR